MTGNKLSVIFFGTPEFGKIILNRLIESRYKPILAVTMPDRPVGRKQIMTPPPVKVLAEQNKIPVTQPEKIDLLFTKGLKIKANSLFIIAAYGKLIHKEVLDTAKYGALNVHPSLLPRWRGPSPIQYTILNGDAKTGVTIMLTDEKVDHGPIVSDSELNLRNSKLTSGELSKKLAELGAELLIKTIPKWVAGDINPREQIHENATYTKILTKDDGHIDWSKPAEEIERQIRAFTPWPGTFTLWEEKRIKIIKGRASNILLTDAPKVTAPGQVLLSEDGGIAIQTSKNVLVIDHLQIAGKTEMTPKEFLNGYSQIIGVILK